MTNRPAALERAFELARSGTCPDVAEVRARLKAEGYSQDQLSGPVLIRQLRELCIASVKAAETGPP